MALTARFRSPAGFLGCMILLFNGSCTSTTNDSASSVDDATPALAAGEGDGTATISLAPNPLPVADDEDPAGEMEERWQIKRQQLQMQAEETFLEGQRLFDAGRYKDSVMRFEQTLSHIQVAPIDVDWGSLRERASAALENARRALNRKETERDQEQAKSAYDKLVADERADAERERSITLSLFEDAIQAFMRNDFADAERLATQVLSRSPMGDIDVRANKLRESAREAGRKAFNENGVQRRKDEYRRWLLDIEETRIPYADIMNGPNKDDWRSISEKRRSTDFLSLNISESPQDMQLHQKLKARKIDSIRFPEVSLPEAIGALSLVSEMSMVVDPGVAAELDSSGVILDISNLSGLSVESILNILLEQSSSEDAKLVYTVKHGVILITSQAKLTGDSVPRVHSIQDLTFQLSNFKGPKIGFIPEPGYEFDNETNPLFGSDELAPLIVEPEDILTLVRENIARESWDEDGNAIAETDTRGLFIINSPAVHAQVAEFLDDLRRFSNEVVTVESRFVNIDRGFLQEIGVDWRGLGGTGLGNEVLLNDVTSGLEDNAGLAVSNNGPGLVTGSGLSPAAGAFFNDGSDGDVRAFTSNFFNEISTNGDPVLSALGKSLSTVGGAALQVSFFKGNSDYNAVIHAVEKSENATEITAPVLTIFNRERAYVTVVNQITFIQDFDVDVANSAFIANPNIGVIQEGVVLDVLPTISYDRKYVTLEVHATVANLIRPIREFTTSLAGFTIPVTFQLPELEVQQAETTLRVPDGGSLILGGLKRLRYINRTAEIPWLGRIPVVGVLFRQKGFDDEAASMIVIMKVDITSMDPWR